jgi:hypothetical protein
MKSPIVKPSAQPLPDPTPLDAVRAFGVTLGPSVVLGGLVVGSLVATLTGYLARPLSTRAARLLRPLVALGAAAPVAYALSVRPWMLHWGATAEEIHKPLPWDELAPERASGTTRAVTIDAPDEAVWPWLAQIGQDRGGFYSYEWLENLAGCRMRNADRIHPEWQRRSVGETVPLHPRAGLKLTRFEPGYALGLEGWGTFVLEPIDERTTRLIVRSPAPRGWATLASVLLWEIPHFIMERKMLLGIKERAERAASQRPANPPRRPW